THIGRIDPACLENPRCRPIPRAGSGIFSTPRNATRNSVLSLRAWDTPVLPTQLSILSPSCTYPRQAHASNRAEGEKTAGKQLEKIEGKKRDSLHSSRSSFHSIKSSKKAAEESQR